MELKFEEVLIELDQFEADLQTLVAIEQNYTGKMKASKGQKKLSAAEKEMLKWKAPVHGSTRDLGKLLLGDNATHRRDRSGRNDHNSHSIDQHDQLRMELLLFEWTDAANKMEEQV